MRDGKNTLPCVFYEIVSICLIIICKAYVNKHKYRPSVHCSRHSVNNLVVLPTSCLVLVLILKLFICLINMYYVPGVVLDVRDTK